MAHVKNFGLIGVGSDLQFGKAGTRLINNTGTFNFKAANGTTDAALTAAGITSSAGNVTLTTGNLVLSSNSGVISIGGVQMLERSSDGYPKISGTASVLIPTGNTAARPGTGVAGMVRVNNDSPTASTVEFYDGTEWRTLATGGNTAAIQEEIDNIEASLGAGIKPDGTFNGAGFTGAGLSGVTSFTDAINTVANNAAGKDTLDELFPSSGIGHVIYSTSGNVWAQALPGSTSGVQGYNAKLESLSTNATNGIIVQDTSGSVVARSLVQPVAGLTITHADGVTGNPTFALANDLAGLEGLTTTGYSVRTGDGTWTTRTIAGTAGNIVVTNGDGIASNTDINLATVTQGATGNFVKVTLDTFGRVTGNTSVTTADITGLADSEYLRRDGTNTLTANMNAGGFRLTSVADPVNAQDAATKNYVDNIVTGLSWKQAVHVLAATNIPLTGGATLTIDGQPLNNGERVLLISQTDPYENGIYDVSGIGTAYTLTRSSDANTYQELNGAAVFVQTGVTYADSGWIQTATLTSLTTGNTQEWVQFSGAGAYTGGVGIDITGNVISAKLGAGITDLPTGEIGADVESGKAIQLTSELTGGQLTLVLDGTGITSGLTQSAAGLKIAANGVTNAMLANSSITLNADSGTQDQLSLGQTLLIAGTSGQGITTTVTDNTITINAADATVATKGVASFNSTSFSVSSGAVSLNTVDVGHGGTGATSFGVNQLLIGDGTNPVMSSADLTFVAGATDTLTIGGASGMSLESTGSDAVITSLATNGDIVLVPNGSGSVVVGPFGAGLVQSDPSQPLTVRGNTTLTLNAVTGNIVMQLASGTTSKVAITGTSAANYATGLADNDLVNKKYVDDAIVSGAASGAIKAVKATIPLNANGTTNIGAALPANATVLSVKVKVTVTDPSAILSIGESTTPNISRYMTTAENDVQTTGLYMAEVYDSDNGSVQLTATVSGSSDAGSGSCQVIVEYQVA